MEEWKDVPDYQTMLPWEKEASLRLSVAIRHLIYSGRETALTNRKLKTRG